MKLLVVGAGMYVSGRGTADPGIVMMALAQAAKRIPIEQVVVCAQHASSAADITRCSERVQQLLGRALPVHYELASEVLSSAALGRRFDACIVCVPDHLHHPIGMRVLAAGLHCLMVKPLTPTVREADELIALQQERDLHCVVELHKRFDEGNLMVRRLIAEGALGRLSHMTVEYSQRVRMPREVFASWSSKTNIFQYLGVHYVDLVHFMTGLTPMRALGAGTRGVLSASGIDTYDSVHALVLWCNPSDRSEQLLTQFAIGWIDPDSSSAMSEQRYSLTGARGRVDCDQKNRGVSFTREGSGLEAVNPYFAKLLSTMDGNEFSGYGYRSIERFVLDVADIRAGRVTPAELAPRRPTFRDARPSTAVVEAVNTSLASGSSWQEIHAES